LRRLARDFYLNGETLYTKLSYRTLLRCLGWRGGKKWWRNLWKEIWAVNMVY
jgi:hypothetical protein